MSTDAVGLRRAPVATSARRSTAGRRWAGRRPEAAVLFGAFAALYLVGAWLLLAWDVVFGDALSRVANAYYVLYSRDPHLAAIGFVWNPLPSLVLLPLLPLSALFPVLVERGLAGAVASSLAMAVAVAGVAWCLAGLGVGRIPRIVLTVLFGLHPMIALYAASGLSEPLLLCFLVLATGALIRWCADSHPNRLVFAGLALGLAYLTRYEAVAPALAAAALVGTVAFRRSSGSFRFRCGLALNDVLLVTAPFVFAFVTWAAMSRIIVGEWFETFASVYGNTQQVRDAREAIRSSTGTTTADMAEYLLTQIHGLAPLVWPLLVAAAVLAVRRRRWDLLVAPCVFGAVLVFADAAFLTGGTFGWLRFQIAVVPLAFLLAGAVLVALDGRHGHPGVRPARRVAAVAVAVACAAAGLPVTARTLTEAGSVVAREESAMLRAALFGGRATDEERGPLDPYALERAIAGDLDRYGLPDGAVLTDTAYAFAVVLASARPEQFVIPSDRDFGTALEDPAGHGVRYLLVSARAVGSQDALRREWPTLYEDGAGIGELVRGWPGGPAAEWRLYRVRPAAGG